MEFLKGKPAEIVNHAFQTLLATYLILLLAEQLQTGFVSNYLKLDYLLIIVIILGVASVFSEQHKPKHEKITWKQYTFIALLAAAGFIIIKVKTGDLEWLSWLIASVASLLIALLSILILEEDEEEKEEKHFELNKKNAPKVIGITLAALFALTIILSFFGLRFSEAGRIVFGSIFVLFLPGFALTYAFFPQHKEKQIDWLERIALSFALSIAVVPLLVFYFNLIGLKISALTVSLVTLLVIIVAAFIAWKRK